MKQTILRISQKDYKNKLNINKIICIAIAVVTVALNVLFCILHKDDNHQTMLILNIVIDIVGCWAMVVVVSFFIVPYSQKLKLYNSKKTLCRGIVTDISSETQNVQGFDCYAVKVGVEQSRILFLPSASIILQIDQQYCFSVVSNIIIEVEYE